MNERPIISIIAAIGQKTRSLGKGNDLLWRISDDLKRFKSLTMGHPIVMGRKTFESIGRALPGRVNVIITRDKEYTKDQCVIAHSIEQALERAKTLDKDEVFVIGGGEIYSQALPYTNRLYLTLVDDNAEGDVFFPEYKEFTKTVSEESKNHEGLSYRWVTLERP